MILDAAKVLNGSCPTDGRILYNQLLLFSLLGAVKALPESCSAYSPYGHT